jgi:hypothetical protein
MFRRQDKKRDERKTRRGGDYSSVTDSYMLLDNAITQFDPRNSVNKLDSTNTGVMNGIVSTTSKGGAQKRRVMRKGGTGLDGIFGQLSSSMPTMKQADEIKAKLSTGGNGQDCRRTVKKDLRGGTAIVELAPFISSLVLLGLRVANDPVAQRDLTNQLTRMVSLSSRRSAKN